MTLGGFSREFGYLRCRLARRLAVLSAFGLPTAFNGEFRLPAAVSLLGRRLARRAGCGILTACASRLAFRLTLSSRLTRGRLAWPRKPWVFGGAVCTALVVTHAYIFFSGRSRKPRGSPSAPTGMLPYHAVSTTASSASASVLMPDHHPRGSARPVSCYALFE